MSASAARPRPAARRRRDRRDGASRSACAFAASRRPEVEFHDDVEVRGHLGVESDSHTERENLPEEVEPGKVYRNVEVGWVAGARIDDDEVQELDRGDRSQGPLEEEPASRQGELMSRRQGSDRERNARKAGKGGGGRCQEARRGWPRRGSRSPLSRWSPSGVSKLVGPKVSELGDQADEKVKEKASRTQAPDLPDVGGKLWRRRARQLFGGGDDDGEEGAGKGSAAPGHGSGRRMPIQQAVDVAVPVKTAYNQWTRFEDWPEFMHRARERRQVDDATVAFQTKIWGIKKRFEAEILEQRPDERIEWDVSEGCLTPASSPSTG